MQLTPGKLWGMRRMASDRGIFKMIAVDQRPPIQGPIAKHLGVADAPWEEVAAFKRLLVETLQDSSTAMLLDPGFAIPASVDVLSPAKGLVVTLEDSSFSESSAGRRSSDIADWSVAKIKRMGGDAVKVLAWFRPDAGAEIIEAQKDYVKGIGADCARYDIPFLLELLVYPFADSEGYTAEYVEMGGKRSDDVLASVAEFARADYGVDLFKLESPVNAADADGSQSVQALFNELGRLAGRPWVMLSAGAGKKEFHAVLDHAFQAGASGYLAGRAIWMDALDKYPDKTAMRQELDSGSVAYAKEIASLADRTAHAWSEHPCYGTGGAAFEPRGPGFPSHYDLPEGPRL